MRLTLHAIAIAPGEVALAVLRARTLCHELEPRRAWDDLEAIVRAGGTAPHVLLELANAATWAGELRRAGELFDRLRGDPAVPEAVQVRAAHGRAWAAASLGLAHADPRAPIDPVLRLYALVLDDRVDAAARVATELVAQLHEPRACDRRADDTRDPGNNDGREPGRAPDEPVRELWSRRLVPALCAIALARAGLIDDAEAALAVTAPARDDPRDHLSLQLAGAAIAAERGDRAGALAMLQDALPRAERAGFFAGTMWTRIALARLLFQLGRRREATTMLFDARAICRRHGSTAFDALLRGAELEDLAEPSWLDRAPHASSAQLGELVRAELRAALRLARAGGRPELGHELPRVELPARDDFGLDRALLVVGRALLAGHRGQVRLAGQHVRQAAAEAARAGADDGLVEALYEAWSAPGGDPPADRPPLVIDLARHELRFGWFHLSLRSRPTLRALLYAFVAAPDHQLSREAIAQQLWGRPYDPQRNDSSLKSNVRRLRELLAGTALAIRVAKDGYVLVLPPDATIAPA